MGRNGFELDLKKEKQSRCYASFLLSEIGCDAAYWVVVHQEYVQRNNKILEIVKKISRDFAALGGKTLSVYENYGAILSSGISIGCFASGDVDFTVGEAELDLAIKVFQQNGFVADVREDHVAASEKLVLPFHNPNALGNGYWLNIMRKPVARDFLLNQTAYLKRLHSLQKYYLEQYKDTDVHLLKPTAMVYFNALHFACEHHYSASPGMALCCDMDRVIRYREIDWDLLKQWSIEDNAGLRIQLALDICKYFLKTPVPDDFWLQKSKNYLWLWRRIVDEEGGLLISQDGKYNRLLTELASDDKSLVLSLISRIWRK